MCECVDVVVDVFRQGRTERHFFGRGKHWSGTREGFATAEAAVRAVGEDGVVVEWETVWDGLVEGVGGGC